MKYLSIIGLLTAMGVAAWFWNENRNLKSQLESSTRIVSEFASGKLISISTYKAHKSLAKEISGLMIKPNPSHLPPSDSRLLVQSDFDLQSDKLLKILEDHRGLDGLGGLCVDTPCHEPEKSLCCDGAVAEIFIPMPERCVGTVTTRDRIGEQIPCQDGITDTDGGVYLHVSQLEHCGVKLVTYSCPSLDTLWSSYSQIR